MRHNDLFGRQPSVGIEIIIRFYKTITPSGAEVMAVIAKFCCIQKETVLFPLVRETEKFLVCDSDISRGANNEFCAFESSKVEVVGNIHRDCCRAVIGEHVNQNP